MSNHLLSYPDIEWRQNEIPTGKRIAVDTETTGLNPYQGDKAFMFSFANEQGDVSVVERTLENHEMLESFFADTTITKIFHNAKFDIKMIRAAGFEFPDDTPIVDTIVMAKLANENESSYRLKWLCQKYFDYSAKEDDAVDKWKKDNHGWSSYDQIPYPVLLPYAAVDAWNCMLLFHMYAPVVKKFKDMYKLDMRCLKYLIEVEDRGVLIDKRLAKKLAQNLRKENTLRQKQLKVDTGIKLEPSNKRLLGYAIWASGGKVLSRSDNTNEPILDKKVLPKYVKDIPWVQDFIDFKKTDKVIADLNKQIVGNLDGNNVLHTNFNLSQARTGRFSSSGPNLQNINKKSCIREVFVPRKGYHLFYFDYSQIEYRLFAYLSGDEELIDGYRNSTIDMHDKTANDLDISRDEAKTVNFLILYGGGVTGLSSLLNISASKAKSMLDKFKMSTPSLEILKEKLLVEHADKGYIEDPMGKHYHLKSGDENKIVNTLIQGFACNVLKYGTLNVKDLIKDDDSYMIQQIHDENIYEIGEKNMAIVPLIKSTLETIPQIDLPLVVDVQYSKTNWADKIDYPKEQLKKWSMFNE